MPCYSDPSPAYTTPPCTRLGTSIIVASVFKLSVIKETQATCALLIDKYLRTIMKALRLILALFWLIGIICGCKPSNDVTHANDAITSEGSETRGRQSVPHLYTESELAIILSNGMSKAAVLQRFGVPASDLSLGESGSRRLDFPFDEVDPILKTTRRDF
jgi:hypothetical protein